jgi:hypothetical protein
MVCKTQYSWMLVLSKLINRFSVISVRIPARFLLKLTNLILKFIWKCQGPKIVKITLRQKANKVGKTNSLISSYSKDGIDVSVEVTVMFSVRLSVKFGLCISYFSVYVTKYLRKQLKGERIYSMSVWGFSPQFWLCCFWACDEVEQSSSLLSRQEMQDVRDAAPGHIHSGLLPSQPPEIAPPAGD